MSNALKPNDLIAPLLLWALIIAGCLIGDVEAPRRTVEACPPAPSSLTGGQGVKPPA